MVLETRPRVRVVPMPLADNRSVMFGHRTGVGIGAYELSTIPISDYWAYFLCGDPPSDPNATSNSQTCVDFWNRMSTYPTPPASVIPAPGVPPVSPTLAPASGAQAQAAVDAVIAAQHAQAQQNFQQFVTTVPAYGVGGAAQPPLPSSATNWLLIGGLVVGGLLVVSLFTGRRR